MHHEEITPTINKEDVLKFVGSKCNVYSIVDGRIWDDAGDKVAEANLQGVLGE